MRYEWDENKNALNTAKHEIGFDAMRGFDWSAAITGIDDREDYGELRETAIGFIGVALYYVIFVVQDGDAVRIVSLRPANRAEARHYAKERG